MNIWKDLHFISFGGKGEGLNSTRNCLNARQIRQNQSMCTYFNISTFHSPEVNFELFFRLDHPRLLREGGEKYPCTEQQGDSADNSSSSTPRAWAYLQTASSQLIRGCTTSLHCQTRALANRKYETGGENGPRAAGMSSSVHNPSLFPWAAQRRVCTLQCPPHHTSPGASCSSLGSQDSRKSWAGSHRDHQCSPGPAQPL